MISLNQVTTTIFDFFFGFELMIACNSSLSSSKASSFLNRVLWSVIKFLKINERDAFSLPPGANLAKCASHY